MKIDEGINGKIHAKVRQMLNSKANWNSAFPRQNWLMEICGSKACIGADMQISGILSLKKGNFLQLN